MDTPSRAARYAARCVWYFLQFFYLSACVGGPAMDDANICICPPCCMCNACTFCMYIDTIQYTLHVWVYWSSVCQPCCYIHTHVCLSIGLLALELLSQFSYSLCLLCGWTLTQNRVIILCIMNALHQCLCLNRGLSNNLGGFCKLITNDAKFFIYQWCIGFVIMNFPRLEFYYSIKKVITLEFIIVDF